jgi:predicted nuclease with TOPRIM domain
MSLLSRIAPLDRIELRLTGEAEALFQRLTATKAPLDLKPGSILKLGLDAALGRPSAIELPSPQEELESRTKEVDALRARLASKKKELEELHRQKMKYEEERSELEYYLEITDQQMAMMNERLAGLDK